MPYYINVCHTGTTYDRTIGIWYVLYIVTVIYSARNTYKHTWLLRIDAILTYTLWGKRYALRDVS